MSSGACTTGRIQVAPRLVGLAISRDVGLLAREFLQSID